MQKIRGIKLSWYLVIDKFYWLIKIMSLSQVTPQSTWSLMFSDINNIVKTLYIALLVAHVLNVFSYANLKN